MSDNWLILIPKLPRFVPSKEAQSRALALFRNIAPQADNVSIELSTQVRFIDCGANLERILCPRCAQELNNEWWCDWMEREAEAGYPLEQAKLPCCGGICSLAELLYDWPLGFARFSIEAMNPNIRDLPDTIEREFETILGSRVLKIWRHL